MNFLAILIAGLIPLAVGFIWYNPRVLGNAWMKSIGVDDPETMKQGANMTKIFGLSLVYAMMLALTMGPLVNHQYGIMSLLADLPEASKGNVQLLVNGTEIDYANKFRTFGHGAFHGFLFGMFIVLPVIGTSSLYERRGFKYVAISSGYWIINMMLMGGLICAWK